MCSKQCQWNIDSGSSRHITRGQRKFLSPKEVKSGSVALWDNTSTRIMGKRIANLDNGQAKTQDVLFIKYLNKNIIGVSQIVDKGHEAIFYSKGCKIRKEGSRRLVTKVTRTSENIYVLNKSKREYFRMRVLYLLYYK